MRPRCGDVRYEAMGDLATTTGLAYADAAYARSLGEFGEPVELPRCGGWILRRQIPGTDAHDAMGCYPVFSCRDWSRLCEDVAELEGTIVSLTLVTDPFGLAEASMLERCLDVVRPFKQHHVVDLTRSAAEVASRHHRYYARRALRRLQVDLHPDPAAFLDEWMALYGELAARKGLRGVNAFSRDAFAVQLGLPGTLVLVGHLDGELVGADWYYLAGDVAYGHLAAFTRAGYEVGASYALQWRALEILAERGVRRLDIGGVPGLDEEGGSGLRLFKAGWSTETAPVYLAAKILDRARYAALVRARGGEEGDYFPAYRADESA
jgi:hypothetical protein